MEKLSLKQQKAPKKKNYIKKAKKELELQL